jgi:site-specific DNA-methyltransferase (adenine-specific)
MQIECKDNLKFMQQLQSESIDLIYCDILFGTGKKFKDYQDLKADRKVIEDFYFPRIKEMHRVLKSTGTIYLQMDYRIVHWLRCIMDDVFGSERMINEIIICFNIGGRGKKEFAKKHDNIIVYTKSDIFTFNDKDIRVPYRSVISKKQDRPNITAEKLVIGTLPTNVWNDIPSGLKVKKHSNYFSEKHPKILQRIIKASSNANDLVADFFLGSGTTAIVCKELNRNFIGCDINERAIKITNERLNAKLF